MSRPPRGFAAAWSVIGGGALALVVFQAVHHSVPRFEQGSPRPSVSPSSGSASTAAAPLPIAASTSRRPGVTRPALASQSAQPAAGSSLAPVGSPSPTPPGPAPTRPPAGAVGVTAAVVVPLRGSTPVAVRASVVIPGAPPFPLLGLDLALALQ